jgi:hypothetical protein
MALALTWYFKLKLIELLSVDETSNILLELKQETIFELFVYRGGGS